MPGERAQVTPPPQKFPEVLDTLRRLRERFGVGTFVVLDDWDADLAAVGIARPDVPERLVYFAVKPAEGGEYFVSLEDPPAPGSELPYLPAGDHAGVDFEGLAALVATHLGLARTRPDAPGVAS